MGCGIGKVMLELVCLHIDTNSLFALDFLRPCSLLLLLPLVCLPKTIANATVLQSAELTVLEGNLVDNYLLSFILWPWPLLVEVTPFARSDDLTVTETDLA